jgi:hypothetical protein
MRMSELKMVIRQQPLDRAIALPIAYGVNKTSHNQAAPRKIS